MYVIEVIPLILLPQNTPQILSYFCDQELVKGAIVEIPIGSRKIKAVVISSNLIENKKILIKKSTYQLKKINKIISELPWVSDYQFDIAIWISKNYYAPLGISLKSVLPPFFGKKKYYISFRSSLASSESSISYTTLLSRTKDLPFKIKPYMTGALKDNGQVLILVPDSSFIDFLKTNLDIPTESTMITSAIPNKEYFLRWRDIAENKIKLIIGTRNALLAPFQNLKIIIIIDSHNEMYTSDMTPKYNAAEMAAFVAKRHGVKIIHANVFEGVEGHHDIIQKKYILDNRRENQTTDKKLIDMARELHMRNFWSLSQSLKQSMAKTLRNDKKVLLFSPRKGYMGMLICQNCGTSLKCPNCDIPMRIYQSISLTLVCHRCLNSKPVPFHCANCNSAHIKPAGPVGSQKIFEEVYVLIGEKVLPKAPVLIIDAEVTQNETEEQEALATIIKPEPVVCIATQRIFSYLPYLKFQTIGITNADAMISASDYRGEERFVYQFEKLMDFGPENVFIQTHHCDNPLFDIILSNNYESLYNQQIELRKQLLYPPFSKMIVLSYNHKDKKKAFLEARTLIEKLKMVVIQFKLESKVILGESSPAFISRERNLYHYIIIVKALPTLENLRDLLKYVPSTWKISVNPVNLI